MIELLVVIVIIATLAGVVGPSLLGNVGTAKSTAAKAQLAAFALAIDAYRLDLDAFPRAEDGLSALRSAPPGIEDVSRWRGPYLRQSVPKDPWGREWIYIVPGLANPDSYDLYSLGRDGLVGGEGENADVTSWSGPVVR